MLNEQRSLQKSACMSPPIFFNRIGQLVPEHRRKYARQPSCFPPNPTGSQDREDIPMVVRVGLLQPRQGSMFVDVADRSYTSPVIATTEVIRPGVAGI